MPRTLEDPAALAALRARVGAITPTSPRQWGRMTAHQMLVHVAGGNEAALGRKEWSFPLKGGNPILKLIALRFPLPWPHDLRTGANPAGVAVDEAAFAADRARVLETLDALAAARAETLSPRHPIFGAMSRADWMRWGWRHADHHLRQFGG